MAERASDDPRRSVKEGELVADISARLRKACAHLPDDEFRELVLSIARTKLRYDGVDPHHPPTARRRTGDDG